MRRSALLSFAFRSLAATGLAAGLLSASLPAQSIERLALPQSRPTTRPVPSTDISRWFTELSNSEASVREAARLNLMGLPPLQLREFEKLVRDSLPLTPAQAAALKEIVTHVFLAGDEYPSANRDGFLGVRLGEVNIITRPGDEAPGRDPNARNLNNGQLNGFDGQFRPGGIPTSGVVIIDRMPGFCGARMLQDGDVILGITERPELAIRNPAEMRQAVVTFGAGQTLHFQLLRQGQVIRVPITLDPRPDDADHVIGANPMQKLLDDRKERADEYWDKTFGPMLKEGVG